MSEIVSARALLDGVFGLGIRLVTGVPCSYFKGPIQILEQTGSPGMRYAPAVNEGAAVAMAAGVYLGGQRAMVMSQNSGFGNMINPLTSLALPYGIPMLVLMSLRGWPSASVGEQQHHLMGRVSHSWLTDLEIPHWTLDGSQSFDKVLAGAYAALTAGKTAFVLVPKGAIGDASETKTTSARGGPSRRQAVAALLSEIGNEFILSTTGHLSRELFNQGDRDRNFYMQGSMGHLTSVALGTALTRPDRRFVLLDGDGAALMHLGAMATVGHHLPDNFVHIVFDNGAYESTGSQATAASRADFAAAARACGYRAALTTDSQDTLRPVLRKALDTSGPVLVNIQGVTAAPPGGRASERITLPEIAERFRRSLLSDTPC